MSSQAAQIGYDLPGSFRLKITRRHRSTRNAAGDDPEERGIANTLCEPRRRQAGTSESSLPFWPVTHSALAPKYGLPLVGRHRLPCERILRLLFLKGNP